MVEAVAEAAWFMPAQAVVVAVQAVRVAQALPAHPNATTLVSLVRMVVCFREDQVGVLVKAAEAEMVVQVATWVRQGRKAVALQE